MMSLILCTEDRARICRQSARGAPFHSCEYELEID